MKFDPRKKLEKCFKSILVQLEKIDVIMHKVIEKDKPAKKSLKKRGRKAKNSA